MVKLVIAAATPAQALEGLHQAATLRATLLSRASHSTRTDLPLIFLAMGEAGKVTRIHNDFFTPVTHPALPIAAAPGQMSLAQLTAARCAAGAVRARSFYLFGSPLAQSLSPALHNTAFAALGLPHTYSLAQTSSAGEVARILCEGGLPTTQQLLAPVHGNGEGRGVGALTPHAFAGGANVTMPLKLDVLPLCSAISPEAAAIGAVNVLVALPSSGRPLLYGANTDWLGIAWPIAQRLHACDGGRGRGSDYALVIGAGGTARAAAYACARLGLPLRVHNPRTASKGMALAREFGGQGIEDLSSACGSEGGVPRVLINTLPASLGWCPPAALLGARTIAMDVAYVPRETPFLRAAAAAGCRERVEGVEMLITQGVASLALWLGVAGGGGGGGSTLPQPQGQGGLPIAEITRAVYSALERA